MRRCNEDGDGSAGARAAYLRRLHVVAAPHDALAEALEGGANGYALKVAEACGAVALQVESALAACRIRRQQLHAEAAAVEDIVVRHGVSSGALLRSRVCACAARRWRVRPATATATAAPSHSSATAQPRTH